MNLKTLISSLIFISYFTASAFPADKGFLTVQIESGKNYSNEIKFGPMTLKLIPQVAIWMENAEGKLVKTIFVTRKSAKSIWGIPGANRPESLPVWSYRRGIPNPKGGFMPGGNNLVPDAETGATQTASFKKEWSVPSDLPDGKYKVLVEVNSSYDYNGTYSDKLKKDDPNFNGVNGQPSLVLSGAILIGPKPSQTVLISTGKGDPSGKNGSLTLNLNGMTTALSLLDTITVKYKPNR